MRAAAYEDSVGAGLSPLQGAEPAGTSSLLAARTGALVVEAESPQWGTDWRRGPSSPLLTQDWRGRSSLLTRAGLTNPSPTSALGSGMVREHVNLGD